MIQIAIMGLGTVGTGVAKVVAENAKQIEHKLGEPLQVKTILVRHFKDGPYRQLMTDDFKKIEEDDDIRVVVETIGGVEAAYEYTKRALMAGKHVVTANKQLVAEKGCELLELAKKKNVNYLFEASVGGGIPILHPLTQCMAANRIDEVYGILNGTTNYILTRMVRTGAFFSDALREAQAKGYAEADPTADVEGIDAGRKICILASLAFGKHVYPESVYTKGIREISLEDASSADALDGAVKLIAFVKKLDDGRILPAVLPMFVPHENMISRVDGVFNCVEVCGDAIDRAYFCGRGAGKFPTASAVMGDVIEAVKHHKTVFSQDWEDVGTQDFIAGIDELTCGMFIRFDGSFDEIAISEFASKYLAENSHADEKVTAVSNACLITAPLAKNERDALLDAFKANGMPVSHWMPAMEA